jgi:acyl-coenzyme A synthetase/AMP-(fatty) acid ligase
MFITETDYFTFKMLFPSPRYGAESITRLIDQVDSHIMLEASDAPIPVIDEILQKRPLRNYQIPSLETLLVSSTRPYPFTKTFQVHKHEPFLTLHTSGTTGFPKPILWTHDWANSVLESFRLPPGPNGVPTATHFFGPDRRVLFPFPAFHTSGIYGQLLLTLGTGMTIVLPPAAQSPAAAMEGVVTALEYLGNGDGSGVDIITLPPPHMEVLGSDATMLERLRKSVKSIMFGGGAISDAAGNAVAANFHVINDIGSTELGLWPSLQRQEQNTWNGEPVPEIWKYAPFHPALNIRLDPVARCDEGDVCEAVMVRNEEGGWIQPVFKIYDEEERKLGDSFVRHPRHPKLWRHCGRADDVLNFLTAEKFIPVAAEQKISANDAVEEVVMVGTRRPKAALILRLKEGKVLDDVWDTIEEVNQTSPVYARVSKDMVLVVKEPFLQTAKGSVQKKAMLELYQKELDYLYDGAVETS